VDRDQLTEHLKFAAELGVTGVSRDPAWRTRTEAAGVEGATDAPTSINQSLAPVEGATAEHNVVFSRTTAEALAAVRADIGDCTRCKLHKLGRSQVVFGVGNPDADLMFVGEAPGADEDVQGIPFVGRAGQLLTKIIEAIELKRDDVYIANVIKCRPPQNRNPEPDEVETCEPFLFRQIDLIKPKVIVALGKFAAQALLQSDAPISRLRGRVFDYRGAKLIPTFHPAYLLRNPSSKREVWEDMKLVKRLLNAQV
jgi:uracil-DNA glycosylase family 4